MLDRRIITNIDASARMASSDQPFSVLVGGRAEVPRVESASAKDALEVNEVAWKSTGSKVGAPML